MNIIELMQIIRNSSYLTNSQILSFNKSGYLYLPTLLPLTEIAKVKRRALEHIDMCKTSTHPAFAPSKITEHLSDYFLKSAYHINFFFEELLKLSDTDKLKTINKIGHALHDLDPVFREFSYKSIYRSLLLDLGYQNPKIVQSQYIIKAPRIGGEVKAHQDSSYIITDPGSCIGFWVALEDAEAHNGCMFAIPGSHKNGTQIFSRYENGALKHSTPFEYNIKDAVCLEAKAGTVIVFHGDLVHWSEQNFSEISRHAFVIHAVEGDFQWSEMNWIQRPEYFPFRNWKA